MKITVDLEDFWLDEGDNIDSALKNHIVREVTRSIYGSIEKKLEKTIIVKIDEMIVKSMYKKANLFINKYLKEGTIKSQVNENGHYVEKDITIEQYIKNKFQNDSGWSSPNDRIEKLAGSFSEDMKRRYDLLFAAQIVSKMGENDLLKDDVMKQLVENIMKG